MSSKAGRRNVTGRKAGKTNGSQSPRHWLLKINRGGNAPMEVIPNSYHIKPTTAPTAEEMEAEEKARRRRAQCREAQRRYTAKKKQEQQKQEQEQAAQGQGA